MLGADTWGSDHSTVVFSNPNLSSRTARGLQIGNLFVRAAFADEGVVTDDPSVERNVAQKWVLTKTLANGTCCLVASEDLAMVLRVADCFSREFPSVHEAWTIHEAEGAIECDGRKMTLFNRWISVDAPGNFRTWAQETHRETFDEPAIEPFNIHDFRMQ